MRVMADNAQDMNHDHNVLQLKNNLVELVHFKRDNIKVKLSKNLKENTRTRPTTFH